MTIANRLKAHLDAQGVAYETVAHPRTATASETAEAAHVPGNRLAKAVVIHLESGPVLAVVPSSHRVQRRSDGARRGVVSRAGPRVFRCATYRPRPGGPGECRALPGRAEVRRRCRRRCRCRCR